MIAARLVGIVLMIILAITCGGGGGGKTGSDSSWLTITPSPVIVSTIDGKPAKFSITFTSSKTISETLYPVFIDNSGVIDGSMVLWQTGLSYRADLMTAQALSQGTHTGNFSLWLYTDSARTVAYPGSPWTLPYQITISPRYAAHKLIPEMVGVALSATPSGNVLSRSMGIIDNFGKVTSWSATSNQSWLSVTPTGETGGTAKLTLTADPSSLPSDQASYATITLTSTDTTVQAIESIRVGLWKGSNDPQVISFVTDLTRPAFARAFACADPIRPKVYLSYGTDSIDIFNPYTATRVDSIQVSGSSLQSIAVAQDGSTLYVTDSANNRILVFDLVTMTQKTIWTDVGIIEANINSYTRIYYFRPNGVGIIMITNGRSILASNGAALAGSVGIRGPMAAPNDNRTIYTPSKYLLDYSDVGTGSLLVERLKESSGTPDAANIQAVSVSGDGNRLYAAFGSPYQIAQYDPQTCNFLRLLPGGQAYPSNVKVGSDGRVYSITGSGDLLNRGDQLLINAVSGELISAQPLTVLSADHQYTGYPTATYGQLEVIPDAKVVVINTGGSVHFLPTP